MADIQVGELAVVWEVTATKYEGLVTEVGEDGSIYFGHLMRRFREETTEYGSTVTTTSIELGDNRQVADVWQIKGELAFYIGDEKWLVGDGELVHRDSTITLFGRTWAELTDTTLVFRQGVTQ